METIPKDREKIVYCIDAEEGFSTALEQNGLRIIQGSLGYRYDKALVRDLPHPPHECDVILYNLCNPACYDASSWGSGRNDNYRCEVVKIETDDGKLFHWKDNKKQYLHYSIVSESQIAGSGVRKSGSFGGADILRAVKQGGVPLIYFLNPTFLMHVTNYLPLWLDLGVSVSSTIANEFDLPDFSGRFPQSLAKIGRDNLCFVRPIKFRIDSVAAGDETTPVIPIKLVSNRVGDTLAALISFGKGHIFFLPPFQNDVNGCVDLVKDVLPHLTDELEKSAEKNRDELKFNTNLQVNTNKSKNYTDDVTGKHQPERYFMELAVEEARRSKSEDNRPHPLVGAVVVKNGNVLAKAHRGEGSAGDHAEFVALEKKLHNEDLVGATLYTTLEPCTTRNHPKVPCAQRITERKISKVVIGMLDPDPRISGRGERELRKCRIDIGRFNENLAASVEEMNRDFLRAHESATAHKETMESGIRDKPGVSLLEFVYNENEWPFELTKTDNPNIKIVNVGLKNTSGRILHDCHVRIERVESENPNSLFVLFDKPKLPLKPPTKELVSIGAGDIDYIPIAQLDKINFALAATGIELLCHSIEGHTRLDPRQRHAITLKASTETGAPVEEKYALWIDDGKNLRLQKLV
jgi:pyrimidine deaminase RibD-like protein